MNTRAPTVILLPGLDGTGVLFEPFIKALGPEIRTLVVRYSRQAARTDEYMACEDIARAALPAEEPYVLLGESFSGPIALSIAASSRYRTSGFRSCICEGVRTGWSGRVPAN